MTNDRSSIADVIKFVMALCAGRRHVTCTYDCYRSNPSPQTAAENDCVHCKHKSVCLGDDRHESNERLL